MAIHTLEEFEDNVERAKVAADVFNVAGLAYLAFDNNKAIICFGCEQQLVEKFFSDNKRVNAICKGNMALSFMGINDNKASEMLFETLQLQKECFGKTSIEVADVLHNIGKMYFGCCKFKEAISYFIDSLKIKEKNCPNSYTTIKTEFALANAKGFLIQEPFSDNEIKEVCDLYVSVLEKYKALDNINHKQYINTLRVISGFFKRVGRESGGEKLDELIKSMTTK